MAQYGYRSWVADKGSPKDSQLPTELLCVVLFCFLRVGGDPLHAQEGRRGQITSRVGWCGGPILSPPQSHRDGGS